ncbi:MAG: SLOG family protein [Verrucomicrobiales bacterium]|nr:SLOG family protein [Verrucomicrobiales bacterium]
MQDSQEQMAVIVAGGRDYQFTDDDIAKLDGIPIREVVSGGASGADRCGEQWAESRGIPVKRFPADWKTHGRAAGPIRNRQMAEYADAVALFPGGRGTASMAKEAEKAGIVIYDFRFRANSTSS